MTRKRKTRSTTKSNLNRFDKFALILNISVAVLLLLSYLAPIVDPRDLGIIAVLGFGYLFLILSNLVFVAYWLLRFRAFYCLISLVSIFIGLSVMLSCFKLRSSNSIDKTKASSSLRVMAYNVRGFYGVDSLREQPIQTRVAQLVKEIQPDILIFEEYVENRSKIDTTSTSNLFRKALKSGYYCIKPYWPVPVGAPGDSTGNAIFSKYPIVNSGFIPSGKILNIRSVFVDIKYKGRLIRVYSIHLAAVNMSDADKDQYLNGNIKSPFFVLGPLTSAFIARSHQVEFVREHIEHCPYPYIIAGDFNDTPNSFAVNEIGDGLKNAFDEKGSGIGATYYNKFPPLHIDYIFCTPQFDVLSYQAFDKKLSDHKPIAADLKFNE